MEINDAEKFVRSWGIWERGRSHGVAEAVETVDKFLSGGGLTAGQREILLRVYDSLLEINTRSLSASPPRRMGRGWRQAAREMTRTAARSPLGSASIRD
ncbi:hypothetical protein [Mycobacterium numidiamassiliense]|uniref:hypothetical protein n=1 Tax=Mycobacterium numidiamassiliense TaxID=1841861 RepID=UPI00097D21ED|nr:hypothetical protein [Mycobacterium numidiamassiliense]